MISICNASIHTVPLHPTHNHTIPKNTSILDFIHPIETLHHSWAKSLPKCFSLWFCFFSLSFDLLMATPFCLSLLFSSVTSCLLGSQHQLFKQNHSSPLLCFLEDVSMGWKEMQPPHPRATLTHMKWSAALRGGEEIPVSTSLPKHIWAVSCPEHGLPSTLLYTLVFITSLFWYLNAFLFHLVKCRVCFPQYWE